MYWSLRESGNLPSVKIFAVSFSSWMTAKSTFAVSCRQLLTAKNDCRRKHILPSIIKIADGKIILPSVKISGWRQRHNLPSVIESDDGKEEAQHTDRSRGSMTWQDLRHTSLPHPTTHGRGWKNILPSVKITGWRQRRILPSIKITRWRQNNFAVCKNT